MSQDVSLDVREPTVAVFSVPGSARSREELVERIRENGGGSGEGAVCKREYKLTTHSLVR